MALIEGVGDEVTVFVGILFTVVTLIVAWVSTQVADRQLISVIIFDQATFQRIFDRLLNNNNDNEAERTAARVEEVSENPDSGETPPPGGSDVSDAPQGGTNEPEISGGESVENYNQENSGVDEEGVSPPGGQLNNENSENHDAPQTGEELRQHRLDFFESQKKNNLGEPVISCSSSTEESSAETSSPPQEGERESSSPPGGVSGTGPPEPDSGAPEEDEPIDVSTPLQPGMIRLRLKYLNDRERLMAARPEETVGSFKSMNFTRELAENRLVRLIYNGQELRDTSTFEAYRINSESTIHCLVSQVQSRPSEPEEVVANDLDLGSLMFPLFGLILVMIWYCRVSYRQYFNAMSTFALTGITLLYSVALFASWRSNNEQHQHAE